MIKTWPGPYKAFLLNFIPDYVKEGKIWFQEDSKGITFFDSCDNKNSNLRLRHFRSTTIKSESQRLKLIGQELDISLLPGIEFLNEARAEAVEDANKLHAFRTPAKPKPQRKINTPSAPSKLRNGKAPKN